ncbi:MAG: hypothetical protein Ct9H300mP21_05470 [Pseudomonadota bacterium]|nr:MAG: hypothetical protein Ct9H300mP21_05470 [Pseudomonadota bacterium]
MLLLRWSRHHCLNICLGKCKTDLPPRDNIVRVIGQQWSWSFIHAGPDGELDTQDDVLTVNDLHVKAGKLTTMNCSLVMCFITFRYRLFA